MTSRDFAYWLQGFFEIHNAEEPEMARPLTAKQVSIIEKHLSLVFFHEIDPSYTDDKKKQEEMNNIHGNVAVNHLLQMKPDANGNTPRC